MNADTLEKYDRCHRLVKWDSTHVNLLVSPIRALYLALRSGLISDEAAAETKIMELAANPGIDVQGDLYALAKHHASLASTLTTYLKATEGTWNPVEPLEGWESECYDTGKELRRIVLIDRWNDNRKMSEIRSWRTVAETSKYNKPMLLNFIVIGQTTEGRRISPWSRTLSHPRSKQIRFAKKSHKSDGFAESWNMVWRENWVGENIDWLAAMQKDEVFTDLVHSVRVPVSPRREEILKDIDRIERDITRLIDTPPMTRSSCYARNPCRYADVCNASKPSTPSDFGWYSLVDLENSHQLAGKAV